MIYDELYKAVSPVVKNFREDLEKIDKDILTALEKRHPGVRFMHWSRESGTCLMLMPPADDSSWPAKGELVPYLFGTADREHILRSKADIAKYWAMSGLVKLVIYFDGKALRQITTIDAVQLAVGYVNGIEAEWKQSSN